MPSTVDGQVARFNKKLDKHLVERLKAEDEAALRLYRSLERTREELFGKLLALEDRLGDRRTFTQAHLASVLDDVNHTLEAMRDEAVGDLRARLLAGYQAGQEQTYAEVAVFFGQLAGTFKPRVPTDVMLRLLEGRVGLLSTTFDRLRLRLVQQIMEAANTPAPAAQRLAAATVEEVQQRLAQGVAQGEGTKAIAKRLMAPGDGEFVRLSYREAIMQVRLNLNDAYNDGHLQALTDAKETVPELRSRWMSAKVRSTPVCLCLHGQIAEVGGLFSVPAGMHTFAGVWQGTRPPAIGQGAKPRFHLCRSRIVPDHPAWPENPKLAPLTSEERKHYAAGGGWRAVDIAKPKSYATPRST